jgi:hypothetical protein
VISSAHLAPAAFRPAKAGSSTSNASGTGTTVSYQDSDAASTTVTVLKRTLGHLRAGKCLTGGAGKRCTRTVALGSFVHDDTAGADQFHFSGRIAGHPLPPSSYLLALTPHANGHAGPTVRIAFKIVG